MRDLPSVSYILLQTGCRLMPSDTLVKNLYFHFYKIKCIAMQYAKTHCLFKDEIQ
jgi:hypothetical protein